MKAYIIHGWDSNPNKEEWLPWLKQKLEDNQIHTTTPLMPDPVAPKIDKWLDTLKQTITPDEKTILIGHSMGNQAILRYLEDLPKNIKIKACILVAPWFHLKEDTYEDEDDRATARPWLETPINLEKVKQHCDKFIAIFSDDDPFVPLSDSEIFKEKLNAEIILLNNKGHFTKEDGISELPIALEQILKLN